jgi:hypothetical protein
MVDPEPGQAHTLPMRRSPKHVVFQSINVLEIKQDISFEILEKLLNNIHYNDKGCWVRGDDSMIYTRIKIGDRKIPAHRLSYEIFTGLMIAPHLVGCHTCDVKACINPEHIFPGTHSDNMKDAIRKGNKFNRFRKKQEAPLTFYGPNPLRADL